jgi:molecular chaperone Hsp33
MGSCEQVFRAASAAGLPHPAMLHGAGASLVLHCLVTQEAEAIQESRIEVRSYFVRTRNALATRAHFGPLYMDHYLHLMQHGLKLAPALDQILKDALGAITLHLASRPWEEDAAWTVNFQQPLFNVFVTGHSQWERVTGRAFTEDVREGPCNRFIAQTRRGQEPLRQSVIEFEGTDFFKIVEQFFRQSEQRLARFFRHDEEDFVMVTAQPDCDETWLQGLDNDAIRKLDETETLSLLEKRYYRFACGCDLDRILPTMASLTANLVDDLYQGDPVVTIQCPRCGARFPLARTKLEAYLQGRSEE